MISIGVPEAVRMAAEKPRAYLVATDIAPILGLSDATIRAQARAGMLPFPTVVVGQRVRIPKMPFLRWMGYEIEQKEVIA